MASEESGHHHITPISKLIKTFLVLMAFMVATIAWYYLFAGTMIQHTWLSSLINNLGMLGIACFKAVLVINIFMGVKHSSNLVKSYVVLGFVWFTLLTSVFADYATRQWEPVKGWTPDTNTLALPRTVDGNEVSVPNREGMEKQVHEAHKKDDGSH